MQLMVPTKNILRKQYMRWLSIIMFLVICLNGCAIYKVYYDYKVSAKNIGEIKLRDVCISSDKGFWFRTGYLPERDVKTLSGLKSAPPNGIYTVVVVDMNDDRYSGVVDLHSEIGKGFRGDIIFMVGDKKSVTYELE